MSKLNKILLVVIFVNIIILQYCFVRVNFKHEALVEAIAIQGEYNDTIMEYNDVVVKINKERGIDEFLKAKQVFN